MRPRKRIRFGQDEVLIFDINNNDATKFVADKVNIPLQPRPAFLPPILRSPANAAIYAINVPRKINRPRVKSEYSPSDCYDDVDEDNFIFPALGRTVFRANPWDPGSRNDIIKYDDTIHNDTFSQVRLNKSAPIGANDVV